ncbi:MAG: hypothetical protein KDD37_08365 [Bdellovibrionales bacterium]|nr:hypothetical protein [Bdellovibrionales bacterium]
MSTFTCPSQCDDLCKSKPREKYLFKLTDLYPGLTPQERALASKYPVKMLTAYQLSWKAEKACMSIYGSTETGDESDACRHYIWASYLVNEFDKKMAEDILNAHEQNPNQPQEDKAMDLANNRRGTSVAEDLKRSRTYSDSKIIESFKIDLKKGNLIILRPRSKEEIE